MIVIKQLKLPSEHNTNQQIMKKAAERLRLPVSLVQTFHIRRQSIDARKKPAVFFIYEVAVSLKDYSEAQMCALVKKYRDRDILYEAVEESGSVFSFPETMRWKKKSPIVIIGMGPAGLFAAYLLAQAGLEPVLLERGEPVEQRIKDVIQFWSEETVLPESNVQFGEGGAGTFSDGKLNTMIKNARSYQRYVLETFVAHGADPDILYTAKPHIGTDVLRQVIVSMRNRIIEMGGEVHFRSKVTELTASTGGHITGVVCEDGTFYPCEHCILAIGHSARDTFQMLYTKGLQMEQKPFAVGVRVMHSQDFIDYSQYGFLPQRDQLPPADYKLTMQTGSKRGVYSFCMCPGGYVVNASSEPGHLAINGMSNRKRDSGVANSAIVVTVTPSDFPTVSDGGLPPVLSGVQFQRNLEAAAYQIAGGKIPLQRLEDFIAFQTTSKPLDFLPKTKGAWQYADLNQCLPDFLCEALKEAFPVFDQKIHGFAAPDTLLCAVESRTSSPVRILRSDTLESNMAGLYPCGEGAGYAGGITSAAVDGLRCAEKIIEKLSTTVTSIGEIQHELS